MASRHGAESGAKEDAAARSSVDVAACTIRHFHLLELGVDAVSLIAAMNPTFDTLPWDRYDVRLRQTQLLERHFARSDEGFRALCKRYIFSDAAPREITALVEQLAPAERRQFDSFEPFRRRAICRFRLTRLPAGDWHAARQPHHEFSMQVDDYRAGGRKFAEMPDAVIDHVEFRKLLCGVGDLVAAVEPAARHLNFTVHQISTIARQAAPASNAPEGVHQDGADYIVSALVIDRRSVTGGVSVIYGPDRTTEVHRVCLLPGEGLFHVDAGSPLWHDVTEICTGSGGDGNERGVRNILGFDIHVAR